MTIRALYCGGLRNTAIIAWCNDEPVNHFAMHRHLKWNVKGCKAAGFLEEAEDGTPYLSGESISLNIGTESHSLERLPELFKSFSLWVCMVQVGDFEVPVLFMGSYEPDFIPKRKQITHDRLHDAIHEIKQLHSNWKDGVYHAYDYSAFE